MPKKTLKAKKAAKPKKQDGLVVMESPVNPGSQIVVASEFADDSIIEGELMGQALPHFIYQFEQEGKTVTGLSVKGVNEVVRRLNKDPRSGLKIRIRPEFQQITRDVEYNGEKGVEVMVFAENLVDGNSGFGIKFEPYMKQSRKGAYKNTFALEKALAKAERNAKRKLIPEVMATKMIEKLIKADPKTVQAIAAPRYQTTASAPVLPVATTKEQKEKIVLDWVDKAKTGEILIAGLDKVMASNDYTDEFKKKVSQLISTKVDVLENK